MKNKRGRVYIIGAGPGDPGLITVKGLKILKGADCVLYDFLSNLKLLKYTKASCEKVCVGKKDKLHLKEQNEINRLLWEKSGIYKKVVRLKGGDPFVFSRGHEELRYLLKKGVKVEVIPGITSAFAGPASFNIPLTIKNKISSVAVLTGRKKDPNALIDAPGCDTLVYLMGVANISNVIKAILKSGRTKKTPCAFIERATHKKERIVCGNLGTIEKKSRKVKLKPPAVLIVGEVVNHGL